MDKAKKELGFWQTKQMKDTFRVGCWSAAWVATMATAKYGPEFLWQYNDLITSLAYLISLLVSVGMILAGRQQLKGLDEMHQKIQLEAMGLTLGVGLFVGLTLSNMEATKLIPFEAEILHLAILISLTYIFAIIAGHWKYR
jgi:uncharacterized protein YacL